MIEESYSSKIESYIPIIVTNANLKICDADPSQINPKTGQMISEPNYVDVDSIICECGRPKSVRFPHPQFTKISEEHKKESSKWQVLILSPGGFIKFLKTLEDTDLVHSNWLSRR